jgi:Fic family protein
VVDERASKPGDQAPFVEPDEETRALREAENGLRQFDRLVELIDGGLRSNFRLRPSQLMELNRIAVDGLIEHPGSFRTGPISITGTEHLPPSNHEVPGLVDELCDYVNDSWVASNAIHLAAYVMWRLNWIHPFEDGNGRTSRAVSYLVLCVRTGSRLPGAVTIPDRIARNKFPYYDALDKADAAWKMGDIDVSAMEGLLEDHLAAQLVDVFNAAKGER